MRRLLVLLTAAAAALFSPPIAGAWTDYPRADALASQLVGRPITVRCMDTVDEWTATLTAVGLAGSDALAFAGWGPDGPLDYMAVSTRTCEDFLALVQDPTGTLSVSQSDYARAATVIAHEAGHLAGTGTRDEAVAQCFALSNLPALLAAIGVNPTTAQILELDAREQTSRQPAPYSSAVSCSTLTPLPPAPPVKPKPVKPKPKPKPVKHKPKPSSRCQR